MLSLLFAAALVGETLTGPAVALDGVTLLMDGERVRLFGLDAPEMTAPLGPRARAALDDAIGAQDVACLVLDVDSRGRAVASCDVAGADLSAAVLRAGLGTAYRIFTYAAGADPELAARLDAAEVRAREESLGIWAVATTPAADRSLWQAIIDDPRAFVTLIGSVATLIAAFAGFFFGALWSHHLTMKRDEARRRFEAERAEAERDEARRALAAELHAELPWIMKATRAILQAIKRYCPDHLTHDDPVMTKKIQWQQWRPPPMPIYEAHVGQLGLLPQPIAKDIINLGGRADGVARFTANVALEAEGHEVPTQAFVLRDLIRGHENIRRLLVALNQPLSEIAGIEPHYWAKAEAEVGPEPEDAAADADDAPPPAM